MGFERQIPAQEVTRDLALHAIIVATPRDCESRLAFAHVFERARPGRVRSASIALVGQPDDGAMTAIRKLFPALRVRRATVQDMTLASAVQPLRTPVILLHTHSNVLRMALQSPATVKSADDLVRWLSIPVDQ